MGSEDTVPLGQLGALGAERRRSDVGMPELVERGGAGSPEGGIGGGLGGPERRDAVDKGAGGIAGVRRGPLVTLVLQLALGMARQAVVGAALGVPVGAVLGIRSSRRHQGSRRGMSKCGTRSGHGEDIGQTASGGCSRGARSELSRDGGAGLARCEGGKREERRRRREGRSERRRQPNRRCGWRKQQGKATPGRSSPTGKGRDLHSSSTLQGRPMLQAVSGRELGLGAARECVGTRRAEAAAGVDDMTRVPVTAFCVRSIGYW